MRLELATPWLQTQCSSHWAIQLESFCWEGVEFIQLVYCIIIYLSFLNCDRLLIREVQWFYWTQKLLVPVEKFTVRMPKVRMPKVRLELATPGLQTQCSSHWAIQHKSYCWEGVQFIQLVYCIIIYLSFLNCDWLLIREVQWFYWTQKFRGCEFEPHLRHPHCKFLYWYQEFLCPVEPLYFSDEKSITVEKW